MIRRLTLSNYRSLPAQEAIDFGRFTVLVGPNGAGKSNVLDALLFLADVVHMGLAGAVTNRGGIQTVRRWSAGHPYNVGLWVEVDFPGGAGRYGFELVGDKASEYRVKLEEAEVRAEQSHSRYQVLKGGRWIGPEDLHPVVGEDALALPLVAGDARFEPLARILGGLAVYTIFPDMLRKPQKYDAQKPMQRHGENWASILRDQRDATWHADLVAGLQRLLGDIEDVKVQQAAGFLVTRFKHASAADRGKWFDVSQQSDGTLRVAGILTALLQEPPAPVIGIEEPELTVHPGALPLLVDYLREASERSQVIVTTHSPEILDLVEPDQVRVVTREDGETRVRPMADEQVELVRQRLLTLGEVMRSEGLRPQLELPLEA